jgi:hypothetical protein
MLANCPSAALMLIAAVVAKVQRFMPRLLRSESPRPDNVEQEAMPEQARPKVEGRPR